MAITLSNLPRRSGIKMPKKRIGRGYGSGKAKTGGKGTKGQSTRGRKESKPGFEGGQVRFLQRMPKKKGFTPLRKEEIQPVNLVKLSTLPAGSTVTKEVLLKKGWIATTTKAVKILARGEITVSLLFSAGEFTFSEKAREAIVKSGGTITE